MDVLIKGCKESTLSNEIFEFISFFSLLPYIALVYLVSNAFLQCPAAAMSIPKPSVGEPSQHSQNQNATAVQDRQNQWFFAEAVAVAIGDVAMSAERLTLNSRSERVDALQDIYSSLIDIESELALMRRDLANHHGVTDTLMSHPSRTLTDRQKSALDAYTLEIITWHKKAAAIIKQDMILKNYYDHLLELNGVAVFLERFQDLLRSHHFLSDKRVKF